MTEEKQILREIKQLEGTREKVIANSAMRAKIQDSLGQKEAIQDQVKVRDFNFHFWIFVVLLTLLAVMNVCDRKVCDSNLLCIWLL